MLNIRTMIAAAAVAVFAPSVLADVSPEVKRNIYAGLQKMGPKLTPQKIVESPMAGIYEVQISSGRRGQMQKIYVSADGKYMLHGTLQATGFKGGRVDRTALRGSQQQARQQRGQQQAPQQQAPQVAPQQAPKAAPQQAPQAPAVAQQSAEEKRISALLASANVNDMIVYPAKGKTKEVVYVFTDISCGYCKKIHAEVAAYNAMGVEVRYLAFPRAGGAGNDVEKSMRAIWCSADRKGAMDTVKTGGSLQTSACNTSVVKDQHALGKQIGLAGTPAMYTASGKQVGGYVTAAELKSTLGL